MKNLYLFVLSSLIAFSVNAQLNGTYTIGGASPSYSTVAEAVDSLNKKGVNGAVNFHIRSGNYNAQFTIKKISGASATNTITFKPDPANTSTATIQFNNSTAADNYVIRLKSAKYISFDSLSIGNTSAGQYATVIAFNDTCEHISFTNSTIQGSSRYPTSVSTALIWDERGTTHNSHNVTFENNEILNGAYSFYIYGASSSITLQQDKWIIKNNRITGWGYYAIYSYYNRNIEIVNNTITSGTNVYFFARSLYLYYNGTPTITGNTIYNGANGYGYGLYMANCFGLSNNRNDISNNSIHVIGAQYGMYITGCNYSDVYFNTVRINGGTSTNTTTAYLNLTSTSNFKNNILVNMSNSKVMNSLGNSLLPDYNNYHSPVKSAAIIGANSMSVDPMFVSPIDLHIQNVQLNAKALTITGISTDIDGETRKTSTDIGADEFDPDSLDAAALDLKSVYCAGMNTIEFNVLNFGLDTIKSMRIRLGISINGRSFQYQNVSNTSSLASGSTSIINLINYNFISDTNYRLTARIDSINGVIDTVLSNNSITSPTFGTAISGTYTIGGTNPDFSDFTAAVARLTSSGICGPTTFKVRQGLYNQNLLFTAIKGVSLSDTIVFEADTGVSPKPILYTSTFNTVTFNGNQGVTFRNIAIHNNNNNGSVFSFNNRNRLIRIDSCELRADTSNRPGFSSRNIMNNRGNALSGLEVLNSDIRGGYYSIYLYGTNTQDLDSNVLFKNNRIYDWYNYAIYSWYQTGAKFIGNVIEDKDVFSFRYGYYAYYNYDSEFSYNKMYLSHTTSGYGVYLYSFAGTSASQRAKFNNNFISSYYDNSNIQDLLYARSARNSDFYFNSFYLSVNNANSNAVEMSFPSNVNFRNNNIHADAPGVAYNRTGSFISTHNNIYAPGGTVSNLALGASEVSISPFFKSNEDLHVKSIFLNNRGIRINGVSTDIDYETRSTVPDIGADEFDIDTNDIGVVSIVSPTPGKCGADSQLVRVLVLNNGISSQTTFPVSVQVTGAVTASLSGTYSGTLGSAKYDTVDVGYINTKIGGRINFKVWSALIGDTYLDNDTLNEEGIKIDKIPTVPGVTTPIVVCEGIDSTIVSGSTAKTIKWYDALSNGNLLHSGDSFKVNITANDTFYVSASDDYSSSVGELSPYTNSQNITETRTFNQGIRFDVLRPLVIDSLTVNPTDSGTLMVTIRDKDNKLVGTRSVTVVPQAGSKVALGITVSPGSDYRMSAAGSAFGKVAGQFGLDYNRFTRYPYRDADTSMIITGDINGNTFAYYFFYDIKISVEGCDAGIGLIPVSVRSTPLLDLGNDTGYCTGTTINMIANATAPGIAAYRWDNNTNLATRNLTTRGSYSVTATGTNGCIISDTIKVDEIPQPSMSWIDRRYCDNIGNVRLFSGVRYGGTYTGAGIVNGSHFNTSVGPGAYNLSYTYSDGMGCFGQASGAVFIDAAPNVTFAPLADVCQNRYSISVSNGSPSPGYLYDDEGLTGIGTYTPKFAGLDTIYYIGYSSNGCVDTASSTINVKPAPQPIIASRDTVCENETSITISAIPLGGVYSGAGVSGGSFDPVITGSGKHPVYYEAWNVQGCTTKVGKNIIVLEKPNLLFNPLLDICEKTGTYTIAKGFPTSGTFSGNFVDVASSTFDVDAAGVGSFPVLYKILGTNGCSNEITQNLVIKPIPSLNLGGDRLLCGTNTITLDARNSGALYLWNTNATSQKIVVSRNGKYSVYVNLNGCVTEDSLEVTYEATCVGVNERENELGITIYPNPTSDILNISIKKNHSLAPIKISILDAIGKEIYSENSNGLDLQLVSVSEYESGLYFIRIEIDGNNYQSRFSVAH
jgi:hypothetical protein